MRQGVLPLLVALLMCSPASAQEGSSEYMGIDLTAQPETEPEQRSVQPELKAMLDRGVELGCLSFDPPTTFAQTDDRSEPCLAYLRQLAAATSPDIDETPAPPEASAEFPLRAVPLVQLARAAQSGNKRAQFELGVRFELGIGGVETDFERALELYREAGRATPARHGMIVRDSEAGAGGGVSRGQVSPRIPGLPEARARREALEARLEASAIE